jgi:CBS domain-containing protein
MRPPIGFFRGFVLEDAGEHRDTLDIKRGIAAVVQLARVHALRAGSLALPTTARLTAAHARGVIGAETARDLVDALELMSYLRLRHQVEQVRDGVRPDNRIDPHRLGSLDRRHLRDAFAIVRAAQHGLSTRLPQVT